jgi:hypothetical protein
MLSSRKQDTKNKLSRDKYGFKKPTQWVKVNQLQEFEIKYQSVLRKQTKSWNRLFLNNDQQWPELCPERKCSYTFS